MLLVKGFAAFDWGDDIPILSPQLCKIFAWNQAHVFAKHTNQMAYEYQTSALNLYYAQTEE